MTPVPATHQTFVCTAISARHLAPVSPSEKILR
jgi:hypothetical protein